MTIIKKSDEIIKPRSFLLVAEDEVISNPGFPGPCNQKLHLPDSSLFGRGVFKTPRSRMVQTKPRLPVIIQMDRFTFHSVALLHISRELKYLVRVNILDSLGHAAAKMNSWTPRYIMNRGFRNRDGEACFCSSTFMAFTDRPSPPISSQL